MFITVKKKSIILAVILALAVIVGSLVFFEAGIVDTIGRGNRKIAISAVETDEARVALTFNLTAEVRVEAILHALAAHGAKATFFATGEWLEANPDAFGEIIAGGHQAGILAGTDAEIAAAEAIIAALDAEPVSLFRAAGKYNDRILSIAEARGLMSVGYSVNCSGLYAASAGKLAATVNSSSSKGSIILLPASEHAAAAIPLIVLALQNRRLSAVRVDEMVYNTDYSIDRNGVQISNKILE
jgi:peptidoglycan/xylan/chitin deacetylase (PgdA/CDA1 family)